MQSSRAPKLQTQVGTTRRQAASHRLRLSREHSNLVNASLRLWPEVRGPQVETCRRSNYHLSFHDFKHL
eukprot:5364503-Pyramimonas_sp.AAC.1